MTPKEVLIGARKLIESGWCQHANAQRADGVMCPYRDPAAAKFCVDGAMMRAAGGHENNEIYRIAFRAFAAAVHDCTGGERFSVIGFNDDGDTSVDAVLAVFDNAITAQADA